MVDERQKNVSMFLTILGPVGLLIALASLIVLTVADASSPVRVPMYVAMAVGVVIALLGAGNFIYYFSRQTKGERFMTGVMVAAMILVAFVIAVMVNYLAYRHPTSWDLTSTQMYSLSDKTKDILRNLKKDVKLTFIYYEMDEEYAVVSKILDKYRSYSTKIKVERLNPDRDRDVVYHYTDKFDLEKGSQVVVQLGERNSKGEIVWTRNQVVKVDDMFDIGYGGSKSFVGEQKLTEAILKVTSDRKVKIGFTNRNFEAAFDGRDVEELGDLKYELERENKECIGVDPAQPIPQDIDVLAVAGPTSPFTLDELKNLDDFLARGGAAFVMVRSVYNRKPFDKFPLNPWLAKLGVTVRDGFVMDPSLAGPRGEVRLNNFGIHEITRMFNGKFHYVAMFFPKRLDDKEELPEGTKITDLLKTSSYGRWVKDTADLENAEEGVFSVAKAVTGKMPGSDKEFRMVVIGDYYSAANVFFKDFGVNRDFILNCFNWLAEEKTLINIAPKSPSETHFTFTEKKLKAIGYLVLLAMPLIFLAIGVFVWVVRRK